MPAATLAPPLFSLQVALSSQQTTPPWCSSMALKDARSSGRLAALRLSGREPVLSVQLSLKPASHLTPALPRPAGHSHSRRSEEHTSELQSLRHLVCRLLL